MISVQSKSLSNKAKEELAEYFEDTAHIFEDDYCAVCTHDCKTTCDYYKLRRDLYQAADY